MASSIPPFGRNFKRLVSAAGQADPLNSRALAPFTCCPHDVRFRRRRMGTVEDLPEAREQGKLALDPTYQVVSVK